MALPKVSDVFKSTFDDSLKTLVQPAGIVPAGVLVGLAFVVLYPALSGATPALQGFDDLDDAWKVAVLTAIVVIVGYVILSLSDATLRLSAGEIGRDSELLKLLKARNADRIRELDKEVQEAETLDDGRRLRAQRARYPSPDEAAATRLGNILAGAASSISTRYGFDLAATWTHLEVTIAADHKELSKALEDQRTGIHVLLNLSLVMTLFGVVALAMFLARNEVVAGAYLLLIFLVAYLLYRAACARAGSYVDLLEAAVDLHRDDVAKKLGVKTGLAAAADRSAWQEAARFLLYDVESPRVAIGPPKVAVTTSDNLSAKELPPRRRMDVDSQPAAQVTANSIDEYSTIVTAKRGSLAGAAQGGRIALVGPKAWLDPQPDVTVNGIPHTPEVYPGADGVALLVRLPTLTADQTADLVCTHTATVIADVHDQPWLLSWAKDPTHGSREFHLLVTLDRPERAGSELAIALNFSCSWAKEEPVATLDGQPAVVSVADAGWNLDFTPDPVKAEGMRLTVRVPEKSPSASTGQQGPAG